MPVISGFGSGTTSLDQEIRKEDNLRRTTRASQRKTYEEWKAQKLKDRQTLDPVEMHQERLMMTDGDNLAASHLGQQATDAAVAYRHNEDVAQKIRTDVLAKSETLNKTKKSLFDSVGKNDKTYNKFVKRKLDQMFPNDERVKAFKGNDDEEIPEIGLEFLRQAQFSQEAWQEHRGNLREAEIQRISMSDKFLNINEAGDVDTEYAHMAPWMIKGLKKAFGNKEDRITKEAIVKVLTKIAAANIINIEHMSDEQLKEYATLQFNAAFALGKKPTGEKWDAMVEAAIKGLKNKRSGALATRESKGIKDFAGKWASSQTIQNMLTAKIGDPSVVWNDGDFQREVNKLASASGLGPGYFDFANNPDEANEKLKTILGERPYDTAKKSIIFRKNATALAIRAKQAKQDAANERQAHTASVAAAFALNKQQDADDKNGIWDTENGAAAAAFTYINREKFVPIADLKPVLQKIKEKLGNNRTAVEAAQEILEENLHWKDWATQALSHESKYKVTITVKPNTDPIDQYHKLVDNIKQVEGALVARIEAAPAHNYDDRPGYKTWIGGDFDIAKVRSDWNKTIDMRLERLKATFGDKMYGPMFTFPSGGVTRESLDGSFQSTDRLGAINNMADLYKFAAAKLERMRATGHDSINDAKPEGKRVDTGQPIPGLGLSQKQETTVKPLAKAASIALSQGLPFSGPHVPIDQGIILENFIPPGGVATDKYRIPKSWFDDQERLGLTILENDKIMAAARSVAEMFPPEKDQNKAAIALRNIIFYGPRNTQGNLNHTSVSNPFFRNTKVRKGGAGVYGGMKENRSEEDNRIPSRLRFRAKGESIYDKPLNTLILGEGEFFKKLLKYARMPKDDS